jgi:hypothetical protein
MYLILFPHQGISSSHTNTFEAIYTKDMHRVSEALKLPNIKVFKLDSLVEIKEIEVTYQEIPKEMKDE